MDNRKFEKLIDLIINENEEQARALFHDIVVEKSREIYESMMDDGMEGDSPDHRNAMAGLQRTIDFAKQNGYKIFRSPKGSKMRFVNTQLNHEIRVQLDTEGDSINVNFEDYTSGVSGNDDASYFDQVFKQAYQQALKDHNQQTGFNEPVAEGFDDDDMADEGKKFGGQVGQMMDEIGVEEEGMNEEDEELEFDDMDDGEDEMMDIDMDSDEEGSDEEDLEDRVVDLEDKLDQLMAEFEEIMGSDEEGSDDEFDDEAEEDGEDSTDDMEQDNDEEEAMMEAIQLQQMKGLYGSKIGGDNGSQPRSTYADNSGQAGMASRPVRFSSNNEAVPTGPKGPTGYAAKGETSVKGAGSFKNVPAQRKQDLTAAPKPTTTQAAGTNTKSPVAESRRNKRK